MRSLLGKKIGSPGFILLALIMGVFWACQVSQDGGHTYLNIDVDSSFTKYDKLVVVVTDSAAGTRDTVFRKHLSSVSDLSKIPVENYKGQKVNITITGFQNGQAVYQEARHYDGQNPGNTDVVVVDSVTAVTSITVTPRTLTLRLGGAAKEVSAAVSPLKVSQVVFWSTSLPTIATVQASASDGRHALVAPVSIGQAYIVVASQKDPAKTDTVRVAVVDSGTQSSNANLSQLTVSAGPLNNPAFSPDSRVSGASVPNSVASLTVTATVADTAAHLIINGAPAVSGTPSGAIALNVGQDSIFIVVTAQDGTQKTYAIGITRAASSISNNLLYALTTSAGPLNNPVFNSNTRVSGVLVANSVESISLTAALADTLARLTINGSPVASGVASGLIPLNVGVDSIFAIVTAQDGTQRTYAAAITRAAANANSNANLTALTVSSGPLNAPAFDPAKRVSGAVVGNAVALVIVTASAADSGASLIINGTPAKSGEASAAISLAVGVDSIYIIVTAPSAAQKTYVVALTRAPGLSSNANLASLTLSAGALNAPAFSASARVSGTTVANSVASATVTAMVADTTAHLAINGTVTPSGTASAAIPLAVGVDSITIVVTAQDGTLKTYVVAVTRSAPGLSSNANLATLTISAGALNAPAFSASGRVSGATVANSVASTTVTATVADTTARLAVNGIAATSGTASAAISLAVGVDSIPVVVTAQDGTKNTYMIGITRSPPVASSNANLASLTVSAGTVNAPAFSASSRVSGLAVANSVASTTVTATVADTTARLTINGVSAVSGTASAAIPLPVGVDSIPVIVTAQDATQKTYVIAITRAKNANANLSALTVSAGTLNAPAFSASSRVSGAAVANSVFSTTVTATVADTTARLTIAGVATSSGVASAAIALDVGVDSIFVVVTAQDGTTKNTYAIGITRARSANANLSALTASAGTLNNPVFDPTKRVAGVVVANSVTSTTVTATVADTTARLTVASVATNSGAASAAQALAVGVDSIFVVVTAQDGTKKTYVVAVTRSPSSDASLASLTVSPGTIIPALTAGVTAYTVNYTTESAVQVKATPTAAGATMTWNGAALTAGVLSTPAISIGYGSTPINLIVTAQDGITKLTYVLTVVRVDNVPPNSPVLTAMPAKIYTSTPTWSWVSGGGGGNGTYRYQFDNSIFPASGNATVTAPPLSISPALADGPHTLYVQEVDAAGNWSLSGTATTFVMVGPASWYKFDGGDYTDHGFNHNDGTATGVTLTSDRRGTAGGAAKFDGVTSKIVADYASHPADTNTTISFWIKTDSTNLTNGLYAMTGQFSIASGSKSSVSVVISTPSTNNAQAGIIPSAWTHVVGTYDGTSIKIYINGALIATTPHPGLPGNYQVQMGLFNTEYWSGSLDDLRLYNRVLSDAEIANLATSTP